MMEVEITIMIEVSRDNFDKSELETDIIDSFEERTGYSVQSLNIEEY